MSHDFFKELLVLLPSIAVLIGAATAFVNSRIDSKMLKFKDELWERLEGRFEKYTTLDRFDAEMEAHCDRLAFLEETHRKRGKS